MCWIRPCSLAKLEGATVKPPSFPADLRYLVLSSAGGLAKMDMAAAQMPGTTARRQRAGILPLRVETAQLRH
jgi:hypothetical protein